MPPVQTTYNQKMPFGIAGRRATMEEWNTVTQTASAVVRHAAPVEANGVGLVKEWDGTGDYLGIAESSQVDKYSGDGTLAQYEINSEVPVNDMGNIWMTAFATCTYKGAVYWIAASNKVTDTASGNILIPNAEFDSAATADGQLVRVKHRRVMA